MQAHELKALICDKGADLEDLEKLRCTKRFTCLIIIK